MSTAGNGDGNGKQVTPNGKKLGGATGKGFMPGKSGNPSGGRISQKSQHQFGEFIRDWLKKKDWAQDALGAPLDKRFKEPRLETIVKRLAITKPEVLLHYAYGKPAEMLQIQDAEGAPVQFVVKVTGVEIP